MNKNFDWQTEDASHWDELPPSAAANPVSPGRSWLRQSWWLLAGLLLGSWLLYHQVTTRVNEAEAAATTDLLLTVPHLGYNQLVVHPDLQNCQGLAWVGATDSTAD